jgi:hypothetical protein
MVNCAQDVSKFGVAGKTFCNINSIREPLPIIVIRHRGKNIRELMRSIFRGDIALRGMTARP